MLLKKGSNILRTTQFYYSSLKQYQFVSSYMISPCLRLYSSTSYNSDDNDVWGEKSFKRNNQN